MQLDLTEMIARFERNPNGDILVGGTRVTLDTVVAAFCAGNTPEEIIEQYPSLQLADVYAAIAYYLKNRSSVEEYLNERRAVADEVRRENEARFPSAGIRNRLERRRNVFDGPARRTGS